VITDFEITEQMLRHLFEPSVVAIDQRTNEV